MKKILYYILGGAFIVFLGAFIFRMCVMDQQKVLNTITVTENVREAYKNDGKILTHEPYEDMSFRGYMKCYAMVYLPEYGEFQVTVKSNNSSYEKVGTTESAGFDFALAVGDASSGDLIRKFDDYTFTRDKEGLYGYYRLVFKGVTVPENGNITIGLYAAGGNEPRDEMILHAAGQEFRDYRLSKEEIAKIAVNDGSNES